MTIDTTKLMNFPEIYSATGMMELIQQIGFLPLLDSGIEGFHARRHPAHYLRFCYILDYQ